MDQFLTVEQRIQDLQSQFNLFVQTQKELHPNFSDDELKKQVMESLKKEFDILKDRNIDNFDARISLYQYIIELLINFINLFYPVVQKNQKSSVTNDIKNINDHLILESHFEKFWLHKT